MKNSLAKLTVEEMSLRMKTSTGSCDHTERGRKISEGKLGKKTKHQEIEIVKYGSMDEEEFASFISGRASNIQSRMINKRKKYLDGNYNK